MICSWLTAPLLGGAIHPDAFAVQAIQHSEYLGYVWKNQGHVGTEQTTGGYYINAAQAALRLGHGR